MKRAAIITAAASAVVIVGLGALAVPAIAATWTAAAPIVETAAEALSTPTATATADPAPVAATDAEEPSGRPSSDTCDRYTDHGVNEYASGAVVDTKGDLVLTYEVADGDTLIGVMERFCTPSSASIFYANDLQNDPGSFSPGEVIVIRPY